MMAVIDYSPSLLDDITARFDLRRPNAEGLRRAVFELSNQDVPVPLTLAMATGVGKTYLLAALLEYVAAQGVRNMIVVLPGRTVRAKTIANFTPGAAGFITGAEIPKVIITPDNFTSAGAALSDPNVVKLFLLNVHNLVQEDPDVRIAPGSAKSRTLRTARAQETLGGSLLEHLADAQDLFMVLDEAHSYSESARTWDAALKRLNPAARVGLTATPVAGDNIVYEYGLRDAIRDEFVKRPVVASRRGGYRDDPEVGKLRDAKALLDIKAAHYRDFELLNADARQIRPLMLVACQDINHAEHVAARLAGPDMFADDAAVLLIHSDGMTDEVERQLAGVQRPDSPVRAIVQVDMLSQGWDVRNVAVLVPLRALTSATLTEQMIGRGLRLPYGSHTGDEWVDSLDVLTHKSITTVLHSQGVDGRRRIPDTVPSTPDGVGDGMPTSEDAIPAGEAKAQAPATGGVDWLISTDILLPLAGLHEGARDSGDVVDVVAGLGGVARDLGGGLEDPGPPPPPVKVERLRGDDVLFPSSTLEQEPRRLRFTEVEDAWLFQLAREVGDASTSAIDRDEITLDEKVPLRPATQADVFEEVIPTLDAIAAIEWALKGTAALMNGVEGKENREKAAFYSRRFVNAVGGEWTNKRAELAARKLTDATRSLSEKLARESTVVPKVRPVRIPPRVPISLPPGTLILSQAAATATTFVASQYYNDWRRGMFESAKFDAYATEMLIARLLDTSSRIEWWFRLEPTDGTSIEYGLGRRYYPDIVALDRDGIHWIIEGKAERGRDDETVAAKRDAAARVLRQMEGDPAWSATRWGYMIAYQGDVERAQSWADLHAASASVKMT